VAPAETAPCPVIAPALLIAAVARTVRAEAPTVATVVNELSRAVVGAEAPNGPRSSRDGGGETQCSH